MERHDRVAGVVLAGKEGLHADTLEFCLEIVKHLLDFRHKLRIRLLVGHLDHIADIVPRRNECVVAGHVSLEVGEQLGLLLRRLRVVPEMGIFHFPR